MRIKADIIGERERANLVVQLARFLFFPGVVAPYRNVLRNSKPYRNVLRNSKSTQACATPKRVYTRVRRTASSFSNATSGYSGPCSLLYKHKYTCSAIINFLLQQHYISLLVLFCRTLVGSFPLANNGHHSASICVLLAEVEVEDDRT